MAVVKCKPTSPGRRHVVKVVNPELHKGKPFAPLLEKTANPVVVTTMAVSPLVTSVVATSRLIVLLTSNATKTVSQQLLSVLSTIRTVPRTSRWFCTKMANAVTSWPLKASKLATRFSLALMLQSKQATPCRCAISRLVLPFIT